VPEDIRVGDFVTVHDDELKLFTGRSGVVVMEYRKDSAFPSFGVLLTSPEFPVWFGKNELRRDNGTEMV
jgi:hypothetical protein